MCLVHVGHARHVYHYFPAQVKLLIDKSKCNAELLSDMLVNSSGQDEFESELTNNLLKEVRCCACVCV